MNKEELVNLAKELAGLDSLAGHSGDLELLKREYNRIAKQEAESYSERKLNEAFCEYYQQLAGKESSLNATVVEDKKAIIAKANALLERTDIVRADKEMLAIVDEFKNAGHCEKEQDDALWEEFKAVRAKWSEKKNAYFADLKAKNAEKKAQKEAIIEKAKQVLEMENIKQASAAMDALMDEWKSVGFSGKEGDEELWGAFCAVRKEFSAKKKAHYEAMKKEYEERVEKKKALIQEVRFFSADSDFSSKDIAKIKEFRAKWKEIGYAGKENDDALYAEFNGLIQQYFADKDAYAGR